MVSESGPAWKVVKFQNLSLSFLYPVFPGLEDGESLLGREGVEWDTKVRDKRDRCLQSCK